MSNSDCGRVRAAELVSLVGFGVVVVTVVAGMWRWNSPEPVMMMLSPIACMVGTVAGAFVGFQLGVAGLDQTEAARREAERARQEAEMVALTLAASGDPEEAVRIVRALRSPATEAAETG